MWNNRWIGAPRQSPRAPKRFHRRHSRRPEWLETRWLLASGAYVEFDLASNQQGTSLVTDPSLRYAWGLATSPGATGGFSVSDTIGQASHGYSGDVTGSGFGKVADQPVYVPAATGQVYNGNSNEFIIHPIAVPANPTTPIPSAPAEFLYASLDGTIYGFNSTFGQHAVLAASVPGAALTGLALANNGTADQLYATDFLGGKIDVFNANFKPVATSGSFADPNLPDGYRPFNVQNLGGKLYVTYAAWPTAPLSGDFPEMSPPVLGPGGVVDVFDADGKFVGRVASGSPLDQPWGLAIAPQSFGPLAGDLLVANHGDGKINVFDPTPTASGGASLGALGGADGKAFVVGGLWGLTFGNSDKAGDANALYFTAGSFTNLAQPLVPGATTPAAPFSFPVLDFSHGLLGTVQFTTTDPLVAVGTDATAHVGSEFSQTVAAFGSADLPSPTAGPAASYTSTIDWGDGTSTTSGSVVPGGNGGFLVLGSHTYTSAGTDDYRVTVADANGNSATATGTVDVTAATLFAKALPVETHGLAVDGAKVAAFFDTGGADPLANYSATINWGDGQTSSGTIGSGPTPADANSPITGGFFTVVGSHTYASTGDYTLSIAITDTDGSSATVQGTADVAQATLVAHAVPVFTHKLSVDGATVAGFFDTGGPDPLASYSATINWGDGQTSSGTIGSGPAPADANSPIAGGFFTVAGSHTYASTGDYTLTITITDTDGSSATVQGTADVAQATLVAHAVPVFTHKLSVDGAPVAGFFDTGGPDPLANYSATINWGDGQTSSGTIGSGPAPADANSPIAGGFFTVAGSHTYASTGDYTLTITITDTDGSSATVQGTADVAQATLVAHAVPVFTHKFSVDGAPVAAFFDTGGPDPLASYSATINWGDGQTSSGTIGSGPAPADANSPIAGGFFTVAGSHIYASTGDYTLTITITDTDGSSATVQGTADVAQATLVAHALPVHSDALTVDAAKVAAFVDTDGGDPLTNYSATIDWGDGQTASGTIVSGPAPADAHAPIVGGAFFTVSGSHTYAKTGDYTLSITITDTDGASATVQGTADIAQAPLLAVGVPVVVNQGLAVDGAIVAAFTDAGGGDPAANYTATIDWGDGGSATTGTVTGSGNSFIVTGSHTYSTGGDYELKVAIADQDGSAAKTASHAFVDSSTASLVSNAFEQVLHRAPDDSGLSYWNQQIAAGLPPAQFANDLTHSSESYALNVIDPAYQTYLGRAADPSGVAYWTSRMQQGLTDQQIEANFIASPEFYAHAGGTNSGWINAMYQTVLNRPADGQGMNYWMAQLAANSNRSTVATDFAASQEHEGQLVQDDYFTYLGRSASDAEVNYWVAQFEHGATNEDIVSAFIGSPEYVKLHS